jgi:hypothetical protein
MKLLAWLTEAFINAFGITRPRPEQLRTAQFAIGGFLLAGILGAVAVLTFLLVTIHSAGAR